MLQQKLLHLKYPLVILTIAIILHPSCTKFVAPDSPVTQAETVQVFSTDEAANAALVGLYSRMTQGNLFFTSGALTLYPGQSADECYNASGNPDDTRFATNSLVADNGAGNYTRLWRAAYQTIYNANAILEGLDKSTGLSTAAKNQFQGEALVVRSFCYFYLANLYGDIPLALTSDYQVNQVLVRKPVDEVFAKMIGDLQQAKSFLLPTYPATGRARPNRYTASALLSRVYLYRKNWSAAAGEATEVIQSGNYSLLSNLSDVFTIPSNETIWQLARDGGNTGEGFTFLPFLAFIRPTYVLTPALLNAFEPTDKRKTAWIAKSTISGIDYYYPYKYKSRVTTPITESYVVLRLAEQYLVRAEARGMQNDLNGAASDLNMIRNRAGLSSIVASTMSDLFTAVEKERQRELFMEWGHRWQDLVRWGRADAVLGLAKGANWQSTDKLYPIPLSEMQMNPNLVQNPGY